MPPRRQVPKSLRNCAEVIELGELLAEAVRRSPGEARRELVAAVALGEGRPELASALSALDDERLAAALIEGLRWSELPALPDEHGFAGTFAGALPLPSASAFCRHDTSAACSAR